jgi:single-strand DNA-binding protein
VATDNHTTIVGNLVDDPELRFTTTGIAVANLRVAVTQRIQQDGEWRDGDTSSLKWATAKVERSSQRGNGDRVQGRQRQAERGDFNDPPPF